MIKDGWHKICGYDVYIENGKILRGVKPDVSGCGEVFAYVYRWKKSLNCWCNVKEITVDAFRSGFNRKTIIMK